MLPFDKNEKNSNFLSDSVANLTAFDKNYFLVCTGILTFSVGFIKDIVNLSNSAPLGLLISSWVLIAIAIGITLYSFHKLGYHNKTISILISQYYGLFVSLKDLDEDEIQDLENSRKNFDDLALKSAESFNNQQKNSRKFSMLFFSAGLLMLLFFISWSLTNEKKAVILALQNPKDSSTNSYTLRIKPDTLVLNLQNQGKETVPSSEGPVYTLQNVFFDFDRWGLRPESFRELDSLVNILKRNPTKYIEIRAHTDNKGSATYNLLLSEKRAFSVKEYLTSKGIETNKIVTKGFGDKFPIADNFSESGRQRNRRVEFKFLN